MQKCIRMFNSDQIKENLFVLLGTILAMEEMFTLPFNCEQKKHPGHHAQLCIYDS